MIFAHAYNFSYNTHEFVNRLIVVKRVKTFSDNVSTDKVKYVSVVSINDI